MVGIRCKVGENLMKVGKTRCPSYDLAKIDERIRYFDWHDCNDSDDALVSSNYSQQ
ncbi:hypothetical protein Fuma_02046 [Fuerstiella marisgermanici]|uniref:Uncharacterized protein n=1 Tax=Fuerstiella marisgermanici TaxID=1891926 RepID=A0A1P8WED9_9PLAN|nr:hypothetical protein Fuma_02046 [Fuerstiella marisgermanici]